MQAVRCKWLLLCSCLLHLRGQLEISCIWLREQAGRHRLLLRRLSDDQTMWSGF